MVLAAANRLQSVLKDAVLVGGTASAVYAEHRVSTDADHVVTNLRDRFDQILGELESVAGWKTNRTKRPVLILGSLDGIETGVRQLIREKPLETQEVTVYGQKLLVPTLEEMLRIKAVLILKRNATRDYLDFAALATRLGDKVGVAMSNFDQLYPQASGESALQQLQAQLANPLPFDIAEIELKEYKNLDPKWQDWVMTRAACSAASLKIFGHQKKHVLPAPK